MATAEEAWDRFYRSGVMRPKMDPSPLLVQHRSLLTGGRALEVACGKGQNTLCVAHLGYEVDAIDVSGEALDHLRQEVARLGLPVNIIQADLHAYPFPAETYDLVLVFFYLDRELIPTLKAALKPGGLMAYRTYNINHSKVAAGFTPKHLVALGELRKFFSDFEVIYSDDSAGPTHNISSLFARKGGLASRAKKGAS